MLMCPGLGDYTWLLCIFNITIYQMCKITTIYKLHRRFDYVTSLLCTTLSIFYTSGIWCVRVCMCVNVYVGGCLHVCIP